MTAWPGPAVVFITTLTLAAIAYLLHRWRVFAGLASALGCLSLSRLVLGTPAGSVPLLWGHALNRPLVVLGREWAYTPADRLVTAFVLTAAGLAFLLSLPAAQGWGFYHFGLGTVAFLTMAITARQPLYAFLFLWLAANMAVMVLAGGREGETGGALRFLVLTSTAMMPLLILPHFVTAGTAGAAIWLAIIGFAILMMIIPFHGQLIAIAAHSAPMVPTWTFLTFSPTAFYILLKVLDAYPELTADYFLFDLCRWSGQVTMVIGGLAALGQRRWGYLIGYATLVNWSAGLVAFGQGTTAGVSVAVQMWGWRAVSLLLVGTGWTVMHRTVGEADDMASWGGLLRRRPLATLTLIIGIMTLGLLPTTEMGPRTAWTMALSGAGVGIGALLGLRSCLGESDDREWKRDPEAVIGAAFALLALWLALSISLRSAMWLPSAERILDGLRFLEVHTPG